MNLIVLVLGIVGFLAAGDRLRQINWHTARPCHVAMYLTAVLFSLWSISAAWAEEARIYHLIGLSLACVGFALTRTHWHRGPPATIRTDVGELGPPELEKTR